MDEYRRYKKSTNPYEQPKAPSYRQNPQQGSQPSYRSQDDDRRRELFGDAPQRAAAGRYGDQNRYYGEDSQADAYGDSRFGQQHEEEEISGLKSQIRGVKQESLASTRRAVSKIRETEELAANTMGKLGEQSTQLGQIDRQLDTAKAHSDRAAQQAQELKTLNSRPFFMPTFKNPFTKKSRQAAEYESVRRQTQERNEKNAQIRQYEYESQQRVEKAIRQQSRPSANEGFRQPRSQSDRARYQFEADAEDDEIEDEIDSNLDALGDATRRLKKMALGMNEELGTQNSFLDNISSRVDPLTERVAMTSHKLNKIK